MRTVLLFSVLILLLCGGTAAATDGVSYQFVGKWGSNGTGDGQFLQPSGVAVDDAENVYVADRTNCRVQKFTSDGVFVTAWGSRGSGDGLFANPDGIATSRDGYVYVADSDNNRIQKFSPDGTFVTKWGGPGVTAGNFSHPVGVGVDDGGYVCVTDYGNHRVQRFTSNGSFVAAWSGSGPEWYGLSLSYPTVIAVDGNGDVLVSDMTPFVRRATPTGTLLWAVGGTGTVPEMFRDVGAVAVDDAGRVFVTDIYYGGYGPDSGQDRVQVFNSTGSFLMQFGSEGSGDGQFLLPEGIATGAGGTVYVTDQGNRRVLVFRAVRAVPGGSGVPTDTDGDGVDDDVNGNGRADFADVVLYFNQMGWIAANKPVLLFDYNTNGRIDFADVVWLFTHLGGPVVTPTPTPTVTAVPTVTPTPTATPIADTTVSGHTWRADRYGEVVGPAGGMTITLALEKPLDLLPLLQKRYGFPESGGVNVTSAADGSYSFTVPDVPARYVLTETVPDPSLWRIQSPEGGVFPGVVPGRTGYDFLNYRAPA